jgi:RNA polymerase sigma-70 factor (ECF subfamily)
MSRLTHDRFAELFGEHFHGLHRYLVRLSGEPDLAAELAQESFLRLYQRGSLPEKPAAWLVTVATNLLRNARGTRQRRSRILVARSGADEPSSHPDDAARAVRRALEQLPDRDRRLLLLRAEGFGYREIADALELNEASVGTLLARAKRAFLARYEERIDASR